MKFRDVIALKRALHILVQVPALEPYVRPLLKSEAFMSQYGDTLVGPMADFDQVANQLNQLYRAVALLREILERALPPEKETALAVQIPAPNSLDQLRDQVDDLRRFFDLLSKIGVEEDTGERVIVHPQVQAFDSGSFYMELIVPSLAGIALVGTIMRAAFQASVLWENWKQAHARIAMSELMVKDAKSIADFNEKARTAIAESIANELKKGRFSKVRGEGEAALRAAIMQGSEMLEKRIFFLPPPAVPKEVLMSFPGQKAVERLFSGDPMKLLEASHPEESNKAANTEAEVNGDKESQ